MTRSADFEVYKGAQSTLTFGGAALGILIAGGFNVWEKLIPSTVIFLLPVPMVSTVIVIQWIGQMHDQGDLGRYLGRLEDEMRSALTLADPSTPESLFVWQAEFQVRKAIKDAWWKPDGRWIASAAILVFALIAVGGLVLGVHRSGGHHHGLVLSVAILQAAAYVLIGSWGFTHSV